MQEQIISLKIAKLVNEKGFHSLVGYEGSFYDGKGNVIKWNQSARFIENIYCNAPTQSLLQKWLREEHNIIVTILPNSFPDVYENLTNSQFFFVIHFNNIYQDIDCDTQIYDTYEEALEEGLYEGLKLINHE